MSRIKNGLLCFLVLTLLAHNQLAVGENSHTMSTVTELSSANRLLIIGNQISGTSKDTRTSDDPDEIKPLASFIQSLNDEWTASKGEAPLLRWSVEFRFNDNSLDSYGIGQNFIEHKGHFHSLALSQQQYLANLLKSPTLGKK